jgi:uncharacterized protein YdiU (UPF0061 family)
MLERVVDRVAALIASWQATGFAHGVMNTDNMSILGTTIDLNVFGFLTRFNPSWAPNFIDDQKRYAFKEQPAIALWNLQRLSDSLTGSTADHLPTERAAVLLQRFTPRYERCYLARMRLRLGFAAEGSSHGAAAYTQSAAAQCSTVQHTHAEGSAVSEKRVHACSGDRRVRARCLSHAVRCGGRRERSPRIWCRHTCQMRSEVR